jgi:hypothetical protein
MTRVWMYSLAASNDPDCVRCFVPWRVDDNLIFFGPCKKRIRERLRRELLTDCTHRKMSDNDEDVFIVGVNGGNPQCLRKIVWAGNLVEVMTFAEAHARLNGGRFVRLRKHPSSPLHVRPIMEQGEIVGYEHVSDEHSGRDKEKPYDSWVYDLSSNPGRDGVVVENDGQQNRMVICIDGNHEKVFDRDCCLLLENVFFASGHGIELDQVALGILRKAQPDEWGVDDYAVFGRETAGKAKGLRGTYLEITGNLAERFVKWLTEHSIMTVSDQHPERDKRRRHGCGRPRC